MRRWERWLWFEVLTEERLRAFITALMTSLWVRRPVLEALSAPDGRP